MPLKDIAREADMAAGKSTPYLVSFARLASSTQDKGTGVLSVRCAADGTDELKQANPVQMASAAVTDLAQRLGHTWRFPSGVPRSYHRPPRGIAGGDAREHASRHGVLLAGTATGRLFAAYEGPTTCSASRW